MDITLDTDWGAKGAQLTGAQVQSFIKQQFRELINKDKTLVAADKTLQGNIDTLSQKLSEQKPQLNASTDGCYVAYHRKSDNWPCAVPYWEWPEIEASGEKADGVLVLIDGRAPILVAPNEEKLYWSKFAVDIDLKVGTDHELAYADFSGQTRTAALMSKQADLFGTGSEAVKYAASYCYNYDRSYQYHDTFTDKVTLIGVLKNRWWLPSIAELVVIWKHKYAINLCLSVIKDADLLTDTWYWSSTEATVSTVWRLNMETGAIQGNNNKVSYLHQTRAITSFYSPSIFNSDADEDNLILADDRFIRYGDCAVFIADADSKPIAIKYPLTEEKIQSVILNHRYTDTQISIINTRYQLSQTEGFDSELAAQYLKQYQELQAWQANSITVSRKALALKTVTP